MLTQNSSGIDVGFDFLLLLSVISQSVYANNGFAICKMVCCVKKLQYHGKKKAVPSTCDVGHQREQI